MTNSWLYYKMVNEENSRNNGEARADFFLSVAATMVCQSMDWAEKYKVCQGRSYNLRSRNVTNQVLDDYLPGRHENHNRMITCINTNFCQPCAFSVIPFPLHTKKCVPMR